MNAISRIIKERHAFCKRWHNYPDICTVTEDMYEDLMSMQFCPVYGDNIMGMKTGIGDEFQVKFETDVIRER